MSWMSPSTSEKCAGDRLPPDFVFSSTDDFYYGPSMCALMHYRTGSAVVAIIEFLFQITYLTVAVYLHQERHSVDFSVIGVILLVTVASTVCSVALFWGLYTEQAKMIKPKLFLLQLQICFLLALATLAIIAMSIGIEATNSLFGTFLRPEVMEKDFGPIWPFNISVLAFFSAAIGIWMQVISRGAYDFLMDKEYFTRTPNHTIQMEKKNRNE